MNIFRVVEIGGTQVRRADVTGDFQISNVFKGKTAEILDGDVLNRIQSFVGEKINPETKAIVVLAAGPVEENKIIRELPNFPNLPKDTNLKDLLAELKFPVLVYNDMEGAVYGMAKLLNKTTPFWGITWSTGLGGKYWDGEKIFVNEEIGHMDFAIGDKDALCSCGAINHAESFLGGKNLAKEIGKDLEDVTTAFKNNEGWAREFYESKAKIMGEFLVKVDDLAPVETFIFKGSVATNVLPDANIQNIIKKVFLDKRKKDVSLVLSPDPEHDSLIGAVIMAQKDLS